MHDMSYSNLSSHFYVKYIFTQICHSSCTWLLQHLAHKKLIRERLWYGDSLKFV